MGSDSWKMNSGIVKVEEKIEEIVVMDAVREMHDYLFHGYSGSVYRCAKYCEGRISAYNGGVLDNIITRANNVEGAKAEIITLKDFLKDFEGKKSTRT